MAHIVLNRLFFVFVVRYRAARIQIIKQISIRHLLINRLTFLQYCVPHTQTTRRCERMQYMLTTSCIHCEASRVGMYVYDACIVIACVITSIHITKECIIDCTQSRPCSHTLFETGMCFKIHFYAMQQWIIIYCPYTMMIWHELPYVRRTYTPCSTCTAGTASGYIHHIHNWSSHNADGHGRPGWKRWWLSASKHIRHSHVWNSCEWKFRWILICSSSFLVIHLSCSDEKQPEVKSLRLVSVLGNGLFNRGVYPIYAPCTISLFMWLRGAST